SLRSAPCGAPGVIPRTRRANVPPRSSWRRTIPPAACGMQTTRDSKLAYRDDGFLDSAAARPLRILAEYLWPLDAFARERVHDTIVFFGSARLPADGPLGRYYAEARELARLVTQWSESIPSPAQRFIVCTGGGGGIMEAANRGATDAGGRTIGLNISLPHEQRPNGYITPGLGFEFHYFFMRKLWFAHLARAIVVFPGGFGTLDELFELLTLSQTGKLSRPLVIVLYGTSYWQEIVDFGALARHGMIAEDDLKLFHFVDTPGEALACLQERLGEDGEGEEPALSGSTTPDQSAETGRARCAASGGAQGDAEEWARARLSAQGSRRGGGGERAPGSPGSPGYQGR